MHYVAEEQFGVSADALWPLVSDTSRLNRVIGLQAVDFSYVPRADGGSITTGEYRRFGRVIARWTEHPFEFVRPRRMSILREYQIGPLERALTGLELTPEGTSTRVTVFGDFRPRNLIGRAIAAFVGPRSTRRVVDQCRRFEAYLRGQAPLPFPQLVPRRVDERRLSELLGRLEHAGVSSPIVQHLHEHLRLRPDEDVVGMRPLALADEWGVGRRENLIAFLRATTLGLLEMRWEVLCPNCRIPKAHYSTLRDLKSKAHCETCNITFDANIDRLIEVRFSVAPSIRATSVGVYCSEGPQVTPHIVAQVEVPPRASATLAVGLEGGTYRLRSPQSAGSALVDVAERAPAEVRLDIAPDGIEPGRVLAAPGTATLRLRSRLDRPLLVAVEQQFWPDTVATAALVSTVQEFRDLFSSEVLAPGLQVAIQHVALLFTDLAGSTALYERLGQARAFRVVQEHFRILEEAVQAEQGAVVKTIGDAIMAVFPAADLALRAALAAQARMPSLDVAPEVDPWRLLKVGIHAGPCLAVNLNERFDYFGTTVNTAARAEGQANGGEVILTEDASREPNVEHLLAQQRRRPEGFEVQLRGLSQPVRLLRLRMGPPEAMDGPPAQARSPSAAPNA